MRRCSAKDKQQARRRGFCLLAVLVLTAGVLSLNRYVNTVVKPTLHELAEYEARSAAVQAMNRAVAAELTHSPALCVALFTQGSGLVSLDAAAAGAAQTLRYTIGGTVPGGDGRCLRIGDGRTIFAVTAESAAAVLALADLVA